MQDEKSTSIRGPENMPTIAEAFKPSSFNTLNNNGRMIHAMNDISNAMVEYLEKSKSLLSDESGFDKEEIAKIYYLKGVEHATSIIVRYMLSELASPKTCNPLEQLTIATPSENRFVNAGIVALNALLTYHNATHLCLGIGTGEDFFDWPDEKVVAFLEQHCHATENVLAKLYKYIPEVVPTTSTDATPDTVN